MRRNHLDNRVIDITNPESYPPDLGGKCRFCNEYDHWVITELDIEEREVHIRCTTERFDDNGEFIELCGSRKIVGTSCL